MGARDHRPVDPRYGQSGDEVSFADGYPYLILGRATVTQLADRLGTTVNEQRFRPSIVVSGADAGAEDNWDTVQIGGHTLSLVKPCARCIVVDQDPYSGMRNLTVLRELGRYRRSENKLLFGVNALLRSPPGLLAVGDEVSVLPPAKTRVPLRR
jgi:uncharacterized protein YcbX